MIYKEVPAGGHDSEEMLFNMECGNFSGSGVGPDCDTIASLHAESDTEGQLLEKMISGRYLGETRPPHSSAFGINRRTEKDFEAGWDRASAC